MPEHLAARPPLDANEERLVRTLAHSAHAHADWISHTKVIARRWNSLRTRQIADELESHPRWRASQSLPARRQQAARRDGPARSPPIARTRSRGSDRAELA